MFCMNPYIGRKVILHYSICLIVALVTDKTPTSVARLGKEGVIWHRTLSLQ